MWLTGRIDFLKIIIIVYKHAYYIIEGRWALRLIIKDYEALWILVSLGITVVITIIMQFVNYKSRDLISWVLRATAVGSWQLEFRFRVSEREREREREREFFDWFSARCCRPPGLFWGLLAPRSSDIVDRADRTTSGSPAGMGEWRSGALDGALCSEMVVA